MKAAFEWLLAKTKTELDGEKKTLTRHLKINAFDSQTDFQIQKSKK